MDFVDLDMEIAWLQEVSNHEVDIDQYVRGREAYLKLFDKIESDSAIKRAYQALKFQFGVPDIVEMTYPDDQYVLDLLAFRNTFTEQEIDDIRGFCITRYWDVRPKIESLKKDQLEDQEVAPRPYKPLPGYVYLLKADRWHKIGRTMNPDQRLDKLATIPPFPTEVICMIQSDDHAALETELHERFAGKRVRGEWFLLDEDDVEFVKSLEGSPHDI